jgi:uncharacterized protein YjbI with pentapeptide repeats/DNA-binding CsgD family transcriptional regulator
MAESFFSHLLKGARIVVGDDVDVKAVGSKIGRRIGGGLRSAPAGMAFVDVTGRVDADADGIVFEGIAGMERPIIPRFLVPKALAAKLSRLVEGDSMEIEKQRRAGNTNIEFNEEKFNNIVASLESGMASRSSDKYPNLENRLDQYSFTPYEEEPKRSYAPAPNPPPDGPDDPGDGMRSASDWTKTRDGVVEMDAPDIDGLYEIQGNNNEGFVVTRYSDAIRNGGQNQQEYEHDEIFKSRTAARKWAERDYNMASRGMSSRSGSVNWDKPDRDWGDGGGGMVTSWDLPDGRNYTILDYEGSSRKLFNPAVLVSDANGKKILRREFSSRNEAMDFLKDYHEGKVPNKRGMSSRSGSIDWKNPDRESEDSRGGMVTSWDLPDGKTYTIEVITNYEDPTRRRFIPLAIVHDANGKEILRKEFATFSDPWDFLKDYHEGRDVSSRSGGINWDEPDEDWGDGAGGGITQWNIPGGGYYQISHSDGYESDGLPYSIASVHDSNHEKVAVSKKFSRGSNEAKRFLRDYHEGKVPNESGMSSRTMREQDPRAYDDVNELIEQGMSDQEIYDSLTASRTSGAREITLSKIGQIRSGGRKLTQDSNKRGFVRKKNTRKINDRFDGQQVARLSASRGGRYGERADIEEGLSDVQEIASGMSSTSASGGKWRGRKPTRNDVFPGADLTGANLSNVDLSDVDFTGANLTGADLSGSIFDNADLSLANLTGANLTRANLSGAELRGTRFRDANLRDTVIDPWWLVRTGKPAPRTGKNNPLKQSEVDNMFYDTAAWADEALRFSVTSDYDGYDIEGMNPLSNAIYQDFRDRLDVEVGGRVGVPRQDPEVDFDYSKMSDEELEIFTDIIAEYDPAVLDYWLPGSEDGMSSRSASNLSETKWKGAKVKPEDIHSDMDFSGADLTGAKLRNDELRGKNFSFAKLFNIDLTASQLNRADFTSADMRLAKLQSANLNGAKLSDANLYNADMTGAYLIDARLRGTNLKNANLAEADLTLADLSNADLTNANLTDADLRGANLFGANVTGADFTGARLPDLSETVILGADTARGMSSKKDIVSTLDLPIRDKRKLDNFILETQRTKVAQSSLPENQDAYMNALEDLVKNVSKRGIGYLDKYIAKSEDAKKIKALIDEGMSDDAIMRITGLTERDIRGVKNYGAKSPGEIFINYSIRKKQADVRNKAVTQLGGLDPQKAAEQIENNNVWDLIDSGATDEEIIAEMNDMSISTDSRFKFDEKKLAKIRKKGRVELEVGQKGRNTSRLSLQQLDEENKNRGIAGNDDDVSLDDLGEALAPDDIISGSGVEAEGAAGVAGAEDEYILRLREENKQKLDMAKKIKEALSASYDILEMREERRSIRKGGEKIEIREIAKELGISEPLVQKHLALIDEIRKRVEDGSFADPEWTIPFDEIADIGRTVEGIRQLSEKYNFPETLMSLMAGQVSGFKRRLDTRSVGVDKDYQDFADQVNSLIKAGYTRTEIASMIPTVNSLQALKKRMDVAMGKGLLDKELMSREVLDAIQAIRKGKIDEVSSSMVEKLLSLGVNIDNLIQVQGVKLSPEDIEFASLRSSGKSKREIMELMNISEEQHQRIFSRMSAREKNK